MGLSKTPYAKYLSKNAEIKHNKLQKYTKSIENEK